MKRLKWIGVGLIALVAVGIGIVILRLDAIVHRAVETQSTASLGLRTQLSSAHVSILGGSVSLRRLEIASPAGFKADRMLSLGGAKVGVSVRNLRAQPMSIDEIVIDKPRFVIEQADGKFNFQALLELKSSEPTDTSEPLKLIINNLAVNDAQVVIRPGLPGLEQELTLPIPSFHVRGIGTAEGNRNGAAIKEVVLLVINDLAERASASGKLPKDAEKLLKMNVEQFRAQVQAAVGKEVERVARELTEKLPGDVGKNVDKAIEKGIGDLLNKGKDEKKPAK